MPIPNPKTATLTDDFATIDSAKWTINGTAISDSGALKLQYGSSAYDATNVVSVGVYDFYDSEVVVEIPDTGTLAANSSSIQVQIVSAASDADSLRIYADTVYGIYLQGWNNDVGVDGIWGADFDATEHRWLRLREASGTLYVDVARDGLNWVNLIESPTSTFVWSLSSVRVVLTAQNSETGGSAGYSKLDNFNLAPVWTGPVFESAGAVPSAVTAGASASAPIPSGVTTNDIILLHVQVGGTSATVTPPSGFTQATGSPADTGPVHTDNDNFRLYTYWKRQTSATGSGETTGSYSWTLLDSSGFSVGVAARYSGCTTTGNPIDSASTNAVVATGSTTPSISMTTSAANELVVWVNNSWDGNRSNNVPAGYISNAAGGSDAGLVTATQKKTVAGSTGSLTATWTGDTSHSMATWLGALKPSGGTSIDPGQFFFEF